MAQQPQPQQQTNPFQQHKDIAHVLLYLLLTPALFGLVLQRRGFGIDAVSPKRFMLGFIALWAWHGIGGTVGHWRGASFFSGSFAFAWCCLILPVACWRIYEAYRAYGKRAERHTWFMGVPYLMRLGIPYSVAAFLDVAVLFAGGWFLERFDIALGSFLMWGSVGLLGMTVIAFQQQTRDMRDLMNAELYARRVQDGMTADNNVPAGPVPDPVRRHTPVEDDEVLTTGRRG